MHVPLDLDAALGQRAAEEEGEEEGGVGGGAAAEEAEARRSGVLVGFTASSGAGGASREAMVEVLDWRLALGDVAARVRALRSAELAGDAEMAAMYEELFGEGAAAASSR